MSWRTRECFQRLIDAIQGGRADDAYLLVRDLRLHMWFDSKLTERFYIL